MNCPHEPAGSPTRAIRALPWWVVLSSVLAPLLLIGGWSVAALLQPAGYRSVHDTISALAGLGARDQWVMTIGLAGVGICHGVTAFGLRPAACTGRMVLAAGGAATVVVAALPLPREGTSSAHGVVAAVGFVALALWPVLACRRSPAPAALRPVVAWPVVMVLLGLLVVFAVQLMGRGSWIGLAERLVAGAEALWPLLVVVVLRRARSSRLRGTGVGEPSADQPT